MAERTSNVLLKALEEPPERTVWILCAPSEADLLPTIRSRVRTLRLREPEVADVAALIARAHRRRPRDRRAVRPAGAAPHRHGAAPRDGCRGPRPPRRHAPRGAARCAAWATSSRWPGRIVQAATDDAKALTAERDEAERAEPAALARHRRGRAGAARGARAAEGPRGRPEAPRDPQPARRHRPHPDRPAVAVPRHRSCCSSARDRRARSTANSSPSCARSRQLERRAHARPSLDRIAETRRNLEQNAAPALALESMLVTVASGRTP